MENLLHSPIHPILVHYPIALFVSAFIFEIASLIFKKDFFHHTALQVYCLAVIFMPFVIWAGLWEANEEHLINHPVLNSHRLFAFITLGLSTLGLLSVWGVQRKNTRRAKILFFVLSLLTVVTIFLTAYNGGRMVYEYGIGVEHE